jgi:pimeloyl-ACP methyl ester carboxylesterase
MMQVDTFGSGYPVLFLHGIPTNGRLWDLVVERMSARFRCIVADLPGMGRSVQTPPTLRELPALALALDQLRAKHSIRKWHVVGHDAGCAVAVHYAHRFPGRVERLGLLTPSLFPELKPFYLFELLRKPLLGELLAPAVNLIFWNIVMRLALRDPCARGLAHEFRIPYRGWCGGWRLMDLVRWGDPREVLASVPEMLRTIEAPAAVFHGAYDPAVPVSFGRRAADLLPHGHLTVLNAGHFLPLNQPEAIAKALALFLGYTGGRSAQRPGGNRFSTRRSSRPR